MYKYSYSVPGTVAGNPEWREAAVKANLRRIEFSCEAGKTMEDILSAVPVLTELVEQGAVETASVHIPFSRDGWDLTMEDDSERRRAADNVSALIRGTAPLHAGMYTIHADSERNNPDRPRAIRTLRREIEALLPLLREQNACLNIELLPRTCIGNCAEDLEAIVEGFPEENVGINVDVNHLNHHPEQVPALIRRLSGRIKAFHFSDYDGIDECHWLPPLGVLDWSAIMREIRAISHDVLIIFECWGFLNGPTWGFKRGFSGSRIAGFEKSAVILENLDKIDWNAKAMLK